MKKKCRLDEDKEIELFDELHQAVTKKDTIVKTDWSKVNNILHVLIDQSPNRKVFRQIVNCAIENGFNPYQDEYCFDLFNNAPWSVHLNDIIKVLDQCKPLEYDGEFRTVVSYVCANYLVHPQVLKKTLKLPNSLKQVKRDPKLLSSVLMGEVTCTQDIKDVFLAATMLFDADCALSKKNIKDFKEFKVFVSETYYSTESIKVAVDKLLEKMEVRYTQERLLKAVGGLSEQKPTAAKRKM